MTCPQLLSTVGLALGMVGVAVLFVYGPPQPNLEEGFGIGLENGTLLDDGRTVGDHKTDLKLRRKRYSRLSKLGFGLIFLGFALQLGAVWV